MPFRNRRARPSDMGKLVASAVLAALGAVYFAVDATTVAAHAAQTPPLLVNVLLSLIGYLGTSRMTVAMMPVFVKAKLYGIDLNKPQTKRDADGVLVRRGALGLLPCAGRARLYAWRGAEG